MFLHIYIKPLLYISIFGGLCGVAGAISFPFQSNNNDVPDIFDYSMFLRQPNSMVDSKTKVETLGAVLKGHIKKLKETANSQVDILFLVDSSTSVGKNNFLEEIKFVKKLLSDFTVAVNDTRVAVITFSSRERVIRHVDYFEDSQTDRHKCALLEEDLKKIRYSGGGTFTLGAFREARKVLSNARESASKAIFLVTDGFSNGGDPRPLARTIRNEGVKIFTFGIQNGNVRELYDMASEPKNELCYILDSFEEFEALARRALHEDLYTGRYYPQDNWKCNRLCIGKHCCDPLAACNCGIHTGKYECICPAGYYGNGLRGSCQACPSGTYKVDVQPGDVSTCEKCPDDNYITEPGATSPEQCVCRKGYRNFNGTGCAVLKCPSLVIPKDGYFVNNRCKNVFNAACGLRCKPGYDLRGSGLRICREDGTWSGSDAQCIMKTCPILMRPKNGNMICTTDDFTFNTVCRFTCDTGYKLVGSRKRTCLAIAFWTGINTRCREINCPPLSAVRDGSVQPPSCTVGEVTFGTTCTVTCHPGYSLIGSHSNQCLPDGMWTSAAEVSQCVDTAPPFIMCPSNIEVITDPNDKMASVAWQVPLAMDNSGYVPILTSVPAVMPPAPFPMGTTKVTYIAEDLNKNTADCTFYVKVKDKQKPTIDSCYSPLPIVSPDAYTQVSWEEPVFSDNSDLDVHVRRSHAPGLFQMGKTDVTYTAYDQSGNNNTCTIQINVIPHPCEYPAVPLNGNRTCSEDADGVVCTFTCKDNYAFGLEPAPEYRCAFDNVWEPRDRMPISDCSALMLSTDLVQPASLTFSGLVACQERQALTRLEKDFEHTVTKRVTELCDGEISCRIDNLETTCEHTDINNNTFKIVLGRTRRETERYRRDLGKRFETDQLKNGTITFTYDLIGSMESATAPQTIDAAKLQRDLLVQVMADVVTSLKKDAKRGDLSVAMKGQKLQLADMTFDDDPAYVCDKGSVLLNQSCVRCPVGTFFNVVSEDCESCPVGTFQPSDAHLSCLFCPTNTSTPDRHATSETECKALCLPGTFSPNGLEVCETCRKSYYQSQYGETGCDKCLRGYSTSRRGSMGPEYCKEKCKPGQMSMTGFVPCFPCPQGTYQPKSGKVSCVRCPRNVDTSQAGATNITDCNISDIQSDEPQNQQPFDLGGESDLLADECMDTPCINGATCTSQIFGFECLCVTGYAGVFCEEDIDECEVSPCLNEGTCVDLLGYYSCKCAPGFSGLKCELNLDDCGDNPCLNGACVDQVQGFICDCANGWEGVLCDTNTDDCLPDSCHNDGTCVDDVAGYHCECPVGIEGDNCEIDADDCAGGPCLNAGTCVDGRGYFTCVCPKGFTGVTCETDINECLDQPCAPTAICEDLPAGYKCHCPTGFSGADCTQEVDIYFQMVFPATTSTTDYAKVPMGQDLTSATVCFWMQTDDTENQGTPFSYATADGDNILTLTDYDGFMFFVNGMKVTTSVRANDGIWHHICVLWSSNRGAWKMYMDGLPEDSGRNLANGQVVQGGGQFVIGQEQDNLGGGFAGPESFIGKITQLNVWQRELSLADIEALRLGCEKHLGDVIAWTDISGQLRGNIIESPVEFCKDCPVPENVEYGEVENTGLSAGSIASYTCTRGFNVAGRRERQCLITGEWEGTVPTCTRVQCIYPGAIENGWIEGQRYTFDNRIRYNCNRGYNLVGDNTRYCGEHGFWEGDAPVCEEIKCSIPELSENTRVISPTADNAYPISEDIFFECTAGNQFYTDHTSVFCQRDGTWDRSLPSCDPQTCRQPPSIDNGAASNTADLQEFSVAFSVQYECEYAHELSPNSLNPLGKISCLPTGQWEPNLPECRLVECADPTAIAHGQYNVTSRVFLGQVWYTCDRGYELEHNTVVECLEMGEWEPAPPECIPVRCGRPEAILHGYFSGDEFSYSAWVTYHCDLGYVLLGEGRRECLVNASWSGKSPACKPVSCGKLEAIESGRIIGREYTLNNVVQYVCDEGYTLVGPAERVCRETGKWQNDSPSCTKVECAYPPSIDYGFFLETEFFYEDQIVYTCEEGYFLVGEATRTCQSNTQWSPLPPACQPIECSLPPDVDHAGFLNPLVIASFRIGHRMQYQCDIGFEISQNSLNPIGQIECLISGQWEANTPDCQLVECAAPSPIINGEVDIQGTVSPYETIATYQCNKGHEMQGHATRICEADATWVPMEPVCKPVKCLSPDTIQNGEIDYKDLFFGSVVRYMCNEGFELTGLEVRRCLANVTWSGKEAICQPVHCGEPDDIDNGRISIEGTVYQSSVTYKCNVGYLFIGDVSRSCMANKTWSGQTPVCDIVLCDKPSQVISNGRMIGDVYEFGSTIEYICDEGYYIDGPSSTRTCLASGQWDSPIIVCSVVQCPRLRLKNGFASSFETTFGTTVTFSCKHGYRLEGPAERTCFASGDWSSFSSVCVKYSCPRLDPPANGQVTVRGLLATYECMAGYVLQGAGERDCQANDTWSLTDPMCEPVPCPDITIQDFANGFPTYDSLVYGSSIAYECNVGYVLSGVHQLDCLADGFWSGSPPICELIVCDPPFEPSYSTITGDDYTFQSTIKYGCVDGYRLIGKAERVCMESGFWSSIVPACEQILCPQPVPASFIKISGNSYVYGSAIEYSCEPGYELDGPASRSCGATGEWAGSDPTCLRIECPQPPPLANGRISAPMGHDEGSRIVYSCDEGYRLQGLGFRLCLSTKQWTGSDPYCSKVSCPEPQPLVNGIVLSDSWLYHDEIEYVCNDGFDHVGDFTRTCTSGGTWSGSMASCTKIKCGTPPLPEKAIFRLPPNVASGDFETVANLECEEGYRGIGTSYQRCQANGAWSYSDFRCIVITCPELTSIDNGKVIGSSFEYSNEVEFQCEQSYKLIGASTARCLASGKWNYDNEPYCELIECPDLPRLSNGIIQLEGPANLVGSTVSYTCDKGYRLSSSGEQVCQVDGMWSLPDPYCQLIICDDPPVIENALPLHSRTQYLYNSEARVVCKTGYYISQGDAVLTCSETSEWAGVEPTCSRVNCGPPPPTRHGDAVTESEEYGSEATYVCIEGYRIKGTATTVQCRETGLWVGTVPKCVPINCGKPRSVDNSIIIDTKEYTFNSIVTYICDVGYRLIGQQSSTCLAVGVWSGMPPVCEPISCGPPPDIENAIYYAEKYDYRSLAEYTCYDEFEMDGQKILECSANGGWVGVRPVCNQVSCGLPPVIPHSSTTMTMDMDLGSSAIFICNEGYDSVGSSYAECTEEKIWEYESTPPSCVAKNCGPLSSIADGHVDFIATVYQSEARYSCNPGYLMIGSAIIRCGSNGKWNGHEPDCQPISCGERPSGSHMTVTGSQFTYSETVEYSCETGYKLVGQSSARCTESGDWSEDVPKCLRISCEPLRLPEHGLTIVGDPSFDTYYGDMVELGCDEGYSMSGVRVLTCLESGVWSDETPSCVPVALLLCASSTGLPHSQPVVDVAVGSAITAQCDPGYTPTGDTTMWCNDDQTWTQPEGQCKRVFCGKPRIRDFVNVVRISGNSYYYGDEIQFKCRAGVQPMRSPPVVTCSEDGQWDGQIRCGVTCKQPCQNGGICLGLNRCKCPSGWGGRLCQHAICILPCLNGGKCSAPYRCSCPSGYAGVRCNLAVCQKPCQNGGKCLRPNKCKCLHGYKGAFCEDRRFP